MCWVIGSSMVLRVFLLVTIIAIESLSNFDGIKSSIMLEYDRRYPPQYNNTPLLPHHHVRRCGFKDPHQAVAAYKSGMWEALSHGMHIFVSSPCLGTDSLGNSLGSYFESVLCAQLAGAHYVATAKIWEPKNYDRPSVFLNALPSVFINEPKRTRDESKQIMVQKCKCQGSCHEVRDALWVHGLATTRKLMHDAISAHLTTNMITNTIVSAQDQSTTAIGEILPLIPDVSIHYRCGDNFVGHYGFLPFSAFGQLIPRASRSIFVLAETRSRKTQARKHLAEKCDDIFKSLFVYLTQRFPAAKVLIRRGDDLYTDVARLALSPITICSVSTFCLWPAIANNGTAFFPKTKLVVKGDTSVNLGFKWLTTPSVLLGSSYEFLNSNKLISALGGPVLASTPTSALQQQPRSARYISSGRSVQQVTVEPPLASVIELSSITDADELENSMLDMHKAKRKSKLLRQIRGAQLT